MATNDSFNVIYNDQVLKVFHSENYKVTFPDGKWLLLARRPDDTITSAVENSNISYSLASIWMVEGKSDGPDWLNNDQVQDIGALVIANNKKNDSNDSQQQSPEH